MKKIILILIKVPFLILLRVHLLLFIVILNLIQAIAILRTINLNLILEFELIQREQGPKRFIKVQAMLESKTCQYHRVHFITELVKQLLQLKSPRKNHLYFLVFKLEGELFF